MTPDLDLSQQLELALRLTIALALGAVIGFEREMDRQPAGFRTHALVALGAALFTVISAYGFGSGVPTMIAAQVVTGIGFIGAGTILHHRGSIRGLTTAASLWSVAAVGMAAGAGMLVLAAVGTVLIVVVLAVLEGLEGLLRRWLGITERPIQLDPGNEPDTLP
ncbi:MAG: MgtC/SapB family protein [Candidatus Limnocylindria bacterium]